MGMANVRRTFKLISPEEAVHRLMEAARIKILGIEEIALEESVGRVLAVDIVSQLNIPKRKHAVFDGYAVRSSDVASASIKNPVTLKIIGKTFPGEPPSKLSSGQTVFTASGAPLPKGADAVVKAENIRLLGDTIEIRFPIGPGENVGFIGEDVKKGSLILKRGRFLRPQDVGLLAGIKMKSVKVFKKPRVAIISVGDELVKLSEKEPDQIVNNYALIISSLVSEFGAIPEQFGIIPDNLEEIKKAISNAVKKTHFCITIAGCSVGPKDLVPDAVAALSKQGLIFHGVKLSPGKVMGAGIVNGKPVIMLPGYIASAYAGFYLLIVPLIARYLGLGKNFPLPVVKAKMTKDLEPRSINTFLRVRLKEINGELMADPVHGGSGVLHTLVKSHGYTIVPQGKGLKKNEVIKVFLYDRYEFTDVLTSY